MKQIRLTAALLAIVLLGGCADPGVSSAQSAPEASIDSGTIAYVPLDDRPDNAERVCYLAESLGYTLEMPDEDLFATRLDGQPVNDNGTQYGNRAALYEWVLSQEASGCDLYILSLDQLLSGGLVSSRAMQGENPVTVEGDMVMTESALLESLLGALAADESNTVWLLDTVMRLAPTAGYNGFGLNEYNVLRTYAMAARPALSGGELTVDHIVADYSVGTDGSLIPCWSETPLPDDAVKNYLASRERKLRLADEAQRILALDGYENFHLLIGIDDSSSEDSIQKNEIALLRRGLRKGADGAAQDWLLSGVDDLAFKAVTKLYLDESGWAGGTAAVQYFGGAEDSPACDYDYLPLTAIVDEHLDFFGLRAAGDRLDADLQVLVLTQPADDAQKEACCQTLIDRLNDNEACSLPTILIDASNGAYGTAFHDALVKQSHPGWLLGYSGFLDMAIVTGTALSHGVARYAWLVNGNGSDDAANWAFQKTLTESVVLDFCYKNVVREELLAYVRSDLSGDPNNFYAPPIDLDAVQKRLSDGMAESARAVLKSLVHSNLITSLAPYAQSGWGDVSLSDWSFPWNRAFEVRMDITVGALTAAHKKVLWFYT